MITAEECGQFCSKSFSIVLAGEYHIDLDTKQIAAKAPDEAPMDEIPGIVRRHLRNSVRCRQPSAQTLVGHDQPTCRWEQLGKPMLAFIRFAAGDLRFCIADDDHLLTLIERMTDHQLMPAMQR